MGKTDIPTMTANRADRINRGLIVLFSLTSVPLALTPAFLLVGDFNLLYYAMAAAAIIGVGSVRRVAPMPGLLRFSDYVLEFLRSLFAPAVAGLMWMTFYGAVYWFCRLIQWLGVGANPHSIACWTSIVLGAFLAMGMVLSNIEELHRRIHGAVSGAIPYPGWRSAASKQLVVALVLCAATVGVTSLYSRSTGLYIAIAAGLMFATVPFSAAASKRPALDRERAIEAVAKILRADGYEVDVRPRTFDPAIDALLEPLDVFARKEDRGFALHVRAAYGGKVDWSVASALRTAALVYGDRDQFEVQPVIVLLGSRADESLRWFGARESVRVLELDPPEAVAAALRTEDETELRKLAELYVNLETKSTGALP